MSSPINPQEVNEITRKAGKLLEKLSLDPEMRKPQIKGDGSPVTGADLAVSQFVVEALKPLGFLVVSEEELPKEPPGPNDSYFSVDPLDGTKYFARGEDEYAVCVGFIFEGKPYYGAIYDPIDSRLFWAVKGEGAFCENQKISHQGPKEKLVVYSSGFHKKPQKDIIINELGIGDIREKGSALKFCDIALGEVDFYLRLGPTSEWDTAAAQVILEEANCDLLEVATLETMTYGKQGLKNRGIIAGHKTVVPKVVEFIKKYQIKPKDVSLEYYYNES